MTNFIKILQVFRIFSFLFAAATFILYFIVNGFHLQTISIIDKIAEVTQIILLLIDERQSMRSRQSEVLHTALSE